MSAPDLDPQEAVRLRASPPAIARLSRPMVLALAGAGVLGVGLALVLGLQARAPKPVVIKGEEAPARPAAIVAGPKTYADAPKLGPPLPGDLGGPILAAQARGAAGPPAPIGPTPEAEARQRTAQAARASSLFLTSARGSSPDLPPYSAQPPATTPQADAPAATTDAQEAPAAPNRPEARNAAGPVSAFRPAPPPGRLILQAHTIIPAALTTAVNADLPGPVAAQVTRHVFDSLTGRVVLIPQGSKLIGAYESRVAFGQKRVLLAWERVIFPDGRSLQLDRLVGADAAGRSGLSDRVDAHWGAMAKAALLSSLLGASAELGADDDGDLVRALREGAQDTVNQTGQQLVRKQLDVQPTLTLRAGLPLTILVTRDIVFDAP